jgi:S-adenosylmethionine decarboxylase
MVMGFLEHGAKGADAHDAQTVQQRGKIIAQASILGNNSEFSRIGSLTSPSRAGAFENACETTTGPPLAGERNMDGIHLLGEWYGCAADSPEMTRVQPLRTLCLDASEASGMTIVGDSFHQFEPAGVTGTVLLAESHLAIHTWPEHGFVTIDVYVCNYTTDNSAKAERLLRAMQDAMNPQRIKFQAIHRGGRDA